MPTSKTRREGASAARIVCASPAYLDRRPPPKAIDDLSDHDCVTFAALSAPREWTFRHKGKTTRVAVKSRLSVTTADAALGAAVAGLGLTRLLCYQASKAIEAKQRRSRRSKCRYYCVPLRTALRPASWRPERFCPRA